MKAETLINKLKENENIKPDRFGMAAISYIFKAFGDTVRSKEYWPWSERVNIPWEDTEGIKKDLYMAINMINEAIARETELEEKNRIIIKANSKASIKDLQKRLERINTRRKLESKITERINSTSNITNTHINEITENEA